MARIAVKKKLFRIAVLAFLGSPLGCFTKDAGERTAHDAKTHPSGEQRMLAGNIQEKSRMPPRDELSKKITLTATITHGPEILATIRLSNQSQFICTPPGLTYTRDVILRLYDKDGNLCAKTVEGKQRLYPESDVEEERLFDVISEPIRFEYVFPGQVKEWVINLSKCFVAESGPHRLIAIVKVYVVGESKSDGTDIEVQAEEMEVVF